jgi:hypothetical protein
LAFPARQGWDKISDPVPELGLGHAPAGMPAMCDSGAGFYNITGADDGTPAPAYESMIKAPGSNDKKPYKLCRFLILI